MPGNKQLGIEAKHVDIHELVFNVPESHETYADATHDASHEAGEVADHIVEHTTELETIVAGTPAASGTPKTVCVSRVDMSIEVGEITETVEIEALYKHLVFALKYP